jgi:hypothetical protein
MPAGNGFFSLAIRLFSGSLLHDLGDYAKREARLAVISAGGFLAALTFVLGTIAFCFALAHVALAPVIGTLQSLATLTAVCLVLAVASLLAGLSAARSLTVRPQITSPNPKALARQLSPRLTPRDRDEIAALLLSAVLEELLSRSRHRR